MPATSNQPPASSSQYPAISVVIPNWNGARFLPTCLDSMRRQTYPNFEVIVVDNASTDNSVELIEREYPEVRLVKLPTNRGLTGGANAGIQVAKGEIIALLNNDTKADPQWLMELHRALEADPGAGMAASKMLLFDRRDIIHSAGDFYRVDGVPGNRGVWERDEGQFDGARRVFGACGGAAAYRRAMLKEIGLFDEGFFMYCEDIDLAWRAQLAGYPCAFAPRAIVYHRLSATGGGETASYYCGRNFVFVVVKDIPTPVLKKYWWKIILAQLRIAWDALCAWRGKAARARLRGQLAALCHLPLMLRKRREIQRTRRVSNEYLESILQKP